MQISLSGRITEHAEAGFKDVAEFIQMAKRCGYDGVNLRASQVNPDTTDADFDRIGAALTETGLALTIVDVAVPTEDGQWAGFDRLCSRVAGLGAKRLRSSVTPENLEAGRRLCDTAARYGLRICMQMHTNSVNETFAMAADWCAKVGKANFGMTVEPGNHLMIGEPVNAERLRTLGERVFFVNLQSLVVLDAMADGARELPLSTGKKIVYKRVPIQTNDQVDLPGVAAALAEVGYDGPVNMLEPYPEGEDMETFCREFAAFLRTQV